MADPALRVNTRVPSQCLPTPLRSTWSVLQQLAIPRFANTIRGLGADVNKFSSHPKELLDDVGLARTATQRFVMEDELVIDRIAIPRRGWHKEPFTLATKCRVLAAILQSGRNSELALA